MNAQARAHTSVYATRTCMDACVRVRVHTCADALWTAAYLAWIIPCADARAPVFGHGWRAAVAGNQALPESWPKEGTCID